MTVFLEAPDGLALNDAQHMVNAVSLLHRGEPVPSDHPALTMSDDRMTRAERYLNKANRYVLGQARAKRTPGATP